LSNFKPASDPLSEAAILSEIDSNAVLTSGWIPVTQAMIDGFAEATLDPDPMHIDPDWAAKGPYGTTISFGFLTMSLLTKLMHLALDNEPVSDLKSGHYLNYGFNRLRLVSPVPVDSEVRGVFRIKERNPDDKGREIAVFDCQIEIKGQSRPALVAEWLSVWVPPEAA
jgi:acyl dehydratase